VKVEDMDFVVTDVNYLVERPCALNWATKNLCFAHNYVMVLSADGFVTYETEGRHIIAEKNDVCVFPPGNVRSGTADNIHPWHFISVNFDLTFKAGNQDDFHRCLMHVPQTSGEIKKLFFSLSKIWSGKDPLYRAKSRTIVQEILIALLLTKTQITAPHANALEDAKEYIQENFCKDIPIEHLAEIAGFSLSHFRKLFTQCYGKSPKQYILFLRLNKAKDLLIAGECNVSETACLCGFHNVFYFSDLFKKTFGISPKAFQTQQHEKIFI